MSYTLTIRERNHSWAGRSPAVTVHSRQEEAGAALLEYVQRNWGAEMGTEPPTTLTRWFNNTSRKYLKHTPSGSRHDNVSRDDS